MRITSARIDRARFVVTSCGAAETLAAAMRTDRRGRPAACSAELFLIGAILNIQRKGNLVIEDIHRTLTVHISLDQQRELGVRWISKGTERVLTLDHLYSFVRRLRDNLGYAAVEDPDHPVHPPAERQRRVDAIASVVQALLDATTGHGEASSSFAIDGSAIWAWGKGRPSDAPAKNTEPDQEAPAVNETATPVKAEAGDSDAGAGDSDAGAGDSSPKKILWDADAAWSFKTPKFGGKKTQAYFGYELHAVARVPDEHMTSDDLPILVEGIELTPANFDIVDPSLSIIDRLLAADRPFTELIGDRHYSFKKEERWADQLTARGISQHLDLREGDHGFAAYDHMKIAAAWPHCPGTPDRLGKISKPTPTGTSEEWAEFHRLIDERQQYAFAPHGRTAAGNPRWVCPARNGTVGCPLVDGSVEAANEYGLPIINDPPAADDAPKCCTQKTVTLGPDAERKLRQPHYWGSKEWQRSYNRRTYIEGFFGNLKNPSTEAVGRGFHRVNGIALITLLLGIAVATCNLRQLRNWHERTGNGDPRHPLLTPDVDHGFYEATPDAPATENSTNAGANGRAA